MFRFSSDPHIAEQQMQAVIYHLVALAYVDAHFHPEEKRFIQGLVTELVDQRAGSLGLDAAARQAAVARWTAHFQSVLEAFDHELLLLLAESTSAGESAEHQVLSRVKLHCLEQLERFEPAAREALLEVAHRLIAADGEVDPAEQAFFEELRGLLGEPVELEAADLEPLAPGAVTVARPMPRAVAALGHPFFAGQEQDHPAELEAFSAEAQADLRRVERVRQSLERARRAGAGRLARGRDFRDFAGDTPFVDGHVQVIPPRADTHYQLLVLGDLHGCYSCLKAALLQWDFFGRHAAFCADPLGAPLPLVVFLGDYIDRGRFSFSGVLRTALRLYDHFPGHAVLLRGNHEYYVDLEGQILSPVQPCEALDGVRRRGRRDPRVNGFLAAYRGLFEALPNLLVFHRTLLVHGGLPREQTLAQRWRGLSSLNDPELRFEMLWSDPSAAEAVPDALQAETARFAFGRRQFRRFLARLGCTTLVRGHELIPEGFRQVYDEPEARLLSLFSAGGAQNRDLPARSGYRKVAPAALSLELQQGVTTFAPFPIAYEPFNKPENNGFFGS